MNTTSVTKNINIINIIKDNMDNADEETGIRISKRLRTKIKRAAMYNGMSMVDYLDHIVPEIKMEEV